MWTWAPARPCPSPPPVPAWIGTGKGGSILARGLGGPPTSIPGLEQALWAHAVIQQTPSEGLRCSGHRTPRGPMEPGEDIPRGSVGPAGAALLPGEESPKLRPSNEQELAKWEGGKDVRSGARSAWAPHFLEQEDRPGGGQGWAPWGFVLRTMRRFRFQDASLPSGVAGRGFWCARTGLHPGGRGGSSHSRDGDRGHCKWVNRTKSHLLVTWVPGVVAGGVGYMSPAERRGGNKPLVPRFPLLQNGTH